MNTTPIQWQRASNLDFEATKIRLRMLMVWCYLEGSPLSGHLIADSCTCTLPNHREQQRTLRMVCALDPDQLRSQTGLKGPSTSPCDHSHSRQIRPPLAKCS